MAEANIHTIESSEFKPELKPSHQKDRKPVFGRDRHLVISYGDLISPIDGDWEAEFDKKWDEMDRLSADS